MGVTATANSFCNLGFFRPVRSKSRPLPPSAGARAIRFAPVTVPAALAPLGCAREAVGGGSLRSLISSEGLHALLKGPSEERSGLKHQIAKEIAMQNSVSSDQPQQESAPAVTSSDTSLNEVLASIRQRQDNARSRLQINRRRIHRALKHLGATRAIVSYSGSGDSGQIDQVTIYKDQEQIKSEKKISVLVATSKWSQEGGWIERIKRKAMTLEAALEELVYDWIESEHAGWENNDGASGECTVEVAADEFLLEHITYYTESETTEHVL